MQYATVIAALAIGAIAAPTPDLFDDVKSGLEDGLKQVEAAVKQFSINQIPAKQIFKNGPAAYQKALQKFNAQVPSNVQSAAAATQSGSVTTNPQQYDQAYLTPVSIGSAGTTLNLDFDTGSADLWVFSTELSSDLQSGHDVYDTSSGSKIDGASWQISYGDGSGAGGDVYADTVVVGPVTATSQAVEAATSVSAQFANDQDNDGLLGLAFSSINTVQPQQQTTFFDTVKDTLDQPLFAAYLRAGQPGSYDFGYVDSSKYTGDLAYADIDSSQGFWSFDAGDASSNGNSLGNLGSSIADTGTSLILVNDDVVGAYWGQVSSAKNDQSQGGYTFDCSETLPDFSITVAGATVTTPGQYVNYAPIDGTTCFGGIQSSSGIGFNILGDVFLKSQYVVFDSNGPRIGWAAQA